MSGETLFSSGTTASTARSTTDNSISVERTGIVSSSTTTINKNTTSSSPTMERLELLSRTAILKQGIEGVEEGQLQRSSHNSSEIVLMGTTPIKITPYQHHQNSPSSISTVNTIATLPQKQIFPVDRASRAVSSSSKNGMIGSAHAAYINRASTNGPPLANIASPVSSDGDDHEDEEEGGRDVAAAGPEAGPHSRHAKKRHPSSSRHHSHLYHHPHPIVEARSPVAEFNRGRDAPQAAVSFVGTGTTGGGLPLIPSRFESYSSVGGQQPSGDAAFINYRTNDLNPPPGAGPASSSRTFHRAVTGAFYHPHHRYDVRNQSPHPHHQLQCPDASAFVPPMNNNAHDPSLFHYQTHEHNRSVTRSSTPTSAVGETDEYEQSLHRHQHHQPDSYLHRPPSQSFRSNHQMDGQNQVSDQPSYEALTQDVLHMREQLKEKDVVVSALQQRVNYLENQINELRQLPTGKISHIPVDDMIRIMQEYGSEVSNQTLPQRKQAVKKASIVRQFRRWNPEFFRFFIHVNGEWVPKLGRDGELRRRAEKRRIVKQRGDVVGNDDGSTD